MEAFQAIRKPLATITARATLREAAEQMDEKAVGALLVLDDDGTAVGIVTDRDIVVRAVSRGVPFDARIDAVMSSQLVTLDAHDDLRAALRVFREHAIRRLPLMEGAEVVGMLTVDDLFVDLIADLADLVRPVTGQVIFGHPEQVHPLAPTS
ncbi:MAG TPA: CBS domain-containing protein [Acidimicrobiia bacterium]|nr:CBS domain-containing protein [Acidimicrobiia bacterium]